ncbi:hypothetical protein C0995_011432 [Termitomyces sp. Mi166|nr:hypothetical protein C0995_011432 [Termitomyces sp. Mi166\
MFKQTMSHKSQLYLSECIHAASKSSMLFTLGSVIVKGGKVMSSGFNHQRTRYDEAFPQTGAKAVSMHAEMHAIFNLSGGKAPSTKQHVQPGLVRCIKQPEQGGPSKRFKDAAGEDVHFESTAAWPY